MTAVMAVCVQNGLPEATMTCRNCRDNFTLYLDGTLTPARRGALEEHLRSCPECATAWTDFQRTVSTLQALPRVTPDARLLSRISAALDAERRPARAPAFRWSWQTATALAAAVCVLIGFAAVLQHGVQTPAGSPTRAVLEQGAAGPTAKVPGGEVARGPMSSSQPQRGHEAAEAEGAGKAPALTPGAAPVVTDGGALGSGPAGVSGAVTRGPRVTRGRGAPTGRRGSPVPRRGLAVPAGGIPDHAAPVEPPTRLDALTMKALIPAEVAAEPSPATASRMATGAPAGLGGMGDGLGMPGGGGEGGAPAAAEGMGMGMPGPRGERGPMGPRGPGGAVGPAGARVAAGAPGGRRITYSGEAAVADRAGQPGPGVVAERREPDVRVTFIPPTSRTVGEVGVGAVVVQSDVDVPRAVVRITPDSGLAVTNAAEGGVVWSGRLPPGQQTTVPVRMRADRPGSRKLTVSLSSDIAAANATMSVTVPGFRKAGARAVAGKPEPPKSADVSLVFRETDIREAVAAIGKQAGVRVEIAPDVKGERVNADLREVPVDAALRIICEGHGLCVSSEDGGYRITRP